ncbi:MAG: DUF1566 domain-containing protein [Burkholderiales bacterium]
MHAIDPRHRRHRLGRCAAGMLIAASATGWAAQNEPPGLQPSADGSEVINTAQGLAWSRCVEGMRWSGTACVGKPQWLDQEHALAAATARRAADGKAWRLPRVPELRHLAAQLTQLPQQRPALFPDTPKGWYWSASTTIDTARVNPYDYGNIRRGVTNENVARLSFLHGWAVDMSNGDAEGDVLKRSQLAVRLVRPLKP